MSDKNFIYPPYFGVYRKYQQIDDLLEILHYAKIAKEELTEKQKENGILTLTEFRDIFNKEYSETLGVKINLHITSHKWNKIYKDNDQWFPTTTGFEQ